MKITSVDPQYSVPNGSSRRVRRSHGAAKSADCGAATLADAAYHPGSVTVWRRDDVALLPALCGAADRLCFVATV
jgi:hypothetical protein